MVTGVTFTQSNLDLSLSSLKLHIYNVFTSGRPYFDVLVDSRVDFGLKLDLLEVGHRHVQQLVKTAYMLVEGHPDSHLSNF